MALGEPVDKWQAALAAMGGMTAIGGLIDLAMWQAEKEKLKGRLEDWWLRFTDVKWSNFGRVEAELAIQILDRWAGPRLWSWKRWRFATVITGAVYLSVLLWTLARVAWRFEIWKVVEWSDLLAVPLIALTGVPWIVLFAVSLSLTRLIAAGAARLCRGVLSSIFTFALLLVIHVALLLYWALIPFVLLYGPFYLIGAMFSDDYPPEYITAVLQSIDPGDLWILNSPMSWGELFRWSPAEFDSSQDWGESFGGVTLSSFKIAMDIVANGLRILFALVFLTSFIFRPLIQAPITRLWYGVMNSGKPFTMSFGAIGAIAAMVQVLSK
jgi:hypothetical protein